MIERKHEFLASVCALWRRFVHLVDKDIFRLASAFALTDSIDCRGHNCLAAEFSTNPIAILIFLFLTFSL
jgi:hypothetical protein